jgi:hypothetical protein
VTVAAPAALRRARVAVAPDVLALAGVALVSVVLVALTWARWGDLDNDTGYDLVAGWKVAHGAVPYRDFFYWYGPLAPALTGLALLVGGSSTIAPAVALGLLVASATVALTYALARTHAGPLGAGIAATMAAAVAFSPNQFSFVLPHTGDASLGALFLLGCVLALEKRAFLAAGVLAGIVALTKPEFEFAALAGGLVLLALRRNRREVRAFALPAIAIPAVVYGGFLTQVSAHALVDGNLYPRAFFRIAGTTMLRARFPLTARSIVELGGRLALYSLGAVAIVALSRALSRPRRRAWLLTATGCGAAVVAASLVRPEALRHGLHFAWGWIPAGAVVAAVVLLRRRAQDGVAETVALAVLAGTTYAAFFVEASSPQMAVYAVPLAASFLVRLHLTQLPSFTAPGPAPGAVKALGAIWLAFLAAATVGLTLKDARAENVSVKGPGGTLVESADKARVYQQALDAVVRNTKPGEPILVAPQLTWMYALSRTENPLPQLSLLPGALGSAADARAAIKTLERRHVRLVLIDRRTYAGYGHTSFGGSFDRLLADWIRSHFARIAAFRDAATSPTIDVWSRRAP